MSNANAKKYRCAVGGEWKDLGDFYKSQHKRAKHNNHQNSGMICKEHSQPVRAEITCSVCNRARPIECYSNNERKSDDPRCGQCVAWDTEQEHGVTPIPLATGHVSMEEDALIRYNEPKHTADFFQPEDIPGAPITGPEALGLQPSETVTRVFSQLVGNSEASARVTTASYSETSSVVNENMSTTSSRATVPPHLRGRVVNQSVSVASSHNGDFPPHLRARMERTTIDGDSVSVSSKETAGTPSVGMQLPPHLRGSKMPEQSSEGSTNRIEGSTTGSLSTATTLRKEQEEIAASRKINFNAWDSKGLRHRATKNPTVASSSASVTSTSGKTDQDSNLIGDWDDVPTVPMPQPQSRGNGKWPKASELRISQAELQQQQRMLGRPTYEESDDQRRKSRG